MASHKAGTSAVLNTASERDRKKRTSCYNTGYLYLVTHPGMNPSEQGSDPAVKKKPPVSNARANYA